MGRVLSGLALVILVIACGEKLPEGVAPARVMPSLLFDMHLLDSRLSNLPYDSIRVIRDPAYEAVFNKHGLDSVEFRQTMDYYMSRPGELLGFYKLVQERMEKHIDAEQARIDEELRLRRQADSLLAVRARDSLQRLAQFEEQRDRIKHLLFRHEADSTVDEPVPFTFKEYSRDMYKALGGWELHFVEEFNADSMLQDSVSRDSLRLDSLRLDSVNFHRPRRDSPLQLENTEDERM